MAERIASLPTVPTLAESGVSAAPPDYRALRPGPPRLPADIVDRLGLGRAASGAVGRVQAGDGTPAHRRRPPIACPNAGPDAPGGGAVRAVRPRDGRQHRLSAGAQRWLNQLEARGCCPGAMPAGHRRWPALGIRRLGKFGAMRGGEVGEDAQSQSPAQFRSEIHCQWRGPSSPSPAALRPGGRSPGRLRGGRRDAHHAAVIQGQSQQVVAVVGVQPSPAQPPLR